MTDILLAALSANATTTTAGASDSAVQEGFAALLDALLPQSGGEGEAEGQPESEGESPPALLAPTTLSDLLAAAAAVFTPAPAPVTEAGEEDVAPAPVEGAGDEAVAPAPVEGSVDLVAPFSETTPADGLAGQAPADADADALLEAPEAAPAPVAAPEGEHQEAPAPEAPDLPAAPDGPSADGQQTDAPDLPQAPVIAAADSEELTPDEASGEESTEGEAPPVPAAGDRDPQGRRVSEAARGARGEQAPAGERGSPVAAAVREAVAEAQEGRETERPRPVAPAAEAPQPARGAADPGVIARPAAPSTPARVAEILPVPSAMVEKIAELAELPGPPPHRLTIDLEGIEGGRIAITLRGELVAVEVAGMPQQSTSQWRAEVAAALAARGLFLAGGDTGEREGDGPRGEHQDPDAPQEQARPRKPGQRTTTGWRL